MYEEEKIAKVVSLMKSSIEPSADSAKPKRAPRRKPAQPASNVFNISSNNGQVANGNISNHHNTVIQTLKTTVEIGPPPRLHRSESAAEI